MPDEKARRTFRQHASDVTIGLGRDTYQIESFELGLFTQHSG